MAVKVQYPGAEELMKADLQNLRALAEFLQKTELKFDILSSIKELQKQISNEFDFINEAKNMDTIREGLKKRVPEVQLPRSLWASKRALVMTFVDGTNLCRLGEFKDVHAKERKFTKWAKQKMGKKLLDTLAKAWGCQIFELRTFNADPHPGNICLGPKGIGLLDWGQVKKVSDKLLYDYSRMVQAIHGQNVDEVNEAFFKLGVCVAKPNDKVSVNKIAVTMLDTRLVPGYVIDPFNPANALKENAVTKMPSDLYFVVRTVQLLRGIAGAFDLDYSLASAWKPYADRVVASRHKSFLPSSHQRVE